MLLEHNHRKTIEQGEQKCRFAFDERILIYAAVGDLKLMSAFGMKRTQR